MDWDYVGGSVIVDRGCGLVFRLEIDMDIVLQELLVRTPQDLATVMRLLLRRTDCRERIVQTLQRALRARASFDDLARGFSVLNAAYRQAIEAVSSRAPAGQSTVSLARLE